MAIKPTARCELWLRANISVNRRLSSPPLDPGSLCADGVAVLFGGARWPSVPLLGRVASRRIRALLLLDAEARFRKTSALAIVAVRSLREAEDFVKGESVEAPCDAVLGGAYSAVI